MVFLSQQSGKLYENDDSDSDDVASRDLRGFVQDSGQIWDKLSPGNDHLLFGPQQTFNLSSLHPGQAQIFKLWQIYLDNVNPLLKVTHTPTLQTRMIDAAINVSNIPPVFEALMFSIYCISILSIEDEDCLAMFNLAKEDLLCGYRFGCQQALLKCGLLRTTDYECLTAFYLYIISVRPQTDPRAVSSILGVAIRIAQRLGLNMESVNSKETVLEAEMRRRLWWSLTLFDKRVCQMSSFGTVPHLPSWTCKLPVNVNDFDLRDDMKSAPPASEAPTEALFAVVRAELGNYTFQRAFQQESGNLSNQRTSPDPGQLPGTGTMLDRLEKKLEDKYLSLCNPEIPLHFMTLWLARGALVRFRLEGYYTQFTRTRSDQAPHPTEIQRDAAISWALTMLTCDTKVSTSPLTKGYTWLLNMQFPFFAYIHLSKELAQRPFLPNSAYIWDTMSDNYESRFEKGRYRGGSHGGDWNTRTSSFKWAESDKELFKIFATTILSAWRTHEKALSEAGKPINPPRIVMQVKQVLDRMGVDISNGGGQKDQSLPAPATGDPSGGAIPMVNPGDFSSMNSMPAVFSTDEFDAGLMAWEQMTTQGSANSVDLKAVDWTLMNF